MKRSPLPRPDQSARIVLTRRSITVASEEAFVSLKPRRIAVDFASDEDWKTTDEFEVDDDDDASQVKLDMRWITVPFLRTACRVEANITRTVAMYRARFTDDGNEEREAAIRTDELRLEAKTMTLVARFVISAVTIFCK